MVLSAITLRIVFPAYAGMIPGTPLRVPFHACVPRIRGDDPGNVNQELVGS